jgi:hypothetical protein
LVSVVISAPSYTSDNVIDVEDGTVLTKYAVPAVRPFVVEPKTMTALSTSPCAEPVLTVLPPVIEVHVGVVPP